MQDRKITDGNKIYEMAEELLRTSTKERLLLIAKFDPELVDQFLDALKLMKTDVNNIRNTGYSLLMNTINGRIATCSISYVGYEFAHISEAHGKPRCFDTTFGRQGGSNCISDGVVITPYLPTSSVFSAVILELKQQKRHLQKLANPENDLEEVKTAAVNPKKATLF